MKQPNILQVDNLLKHANQSSVLIKSANGIERWMPARPLPYYDWKMRFKAVWLVGTGKADALLWRGQ